ncbi:MAG: PilZ domain-containing protein [Polyangiales bacterium]
MELSLSTNRRSSSRRPVRMPCEAVRERDFKALGSVVLDLSSTGMLLRSTERVLTGDAVIVSFFEPVSARWFDVEATVARVIHGRRLGDGERAVGLAFNSLRGEEKSALERALRARMPALPRRRSAH